MKLVYEPSCRRWNLDLAIQYMMDVHIVSIQGLIPTLVGLNHGAIQTDPGKDAFARE